MKIVIASAGRRAHYVEWFQEGLRAQGLVGEVVAMEYRTASPSLSLADQSVPMPAYNSQGYRDAMRTYFDRERPELFLSLNDYELQILSQGLADELREFDGAVLVLEKTTQSMVLDKYRMAIALEEYGIPTPVTRLGSELGPLLELAAPGDRFVVKHRFGSGSTGLHFATAADLGQAVAESARTALGDDGRPAQNGPNSVVVQKWLPGIEYGVDGVFAVDRSSRMLGVLARRKDQMRGGDTDVATTVSPNPFHSAMRGIGNLLRPAGAIDVDFRETAEGEPLVIDINPRLGGGYPFCHRAGADLPAALIRSAAGLDHIPSLLEYELNVTTARREEFTVLSAAAEK
ncbi:ATP-grasp domain-containing protein [Nesterenkonia natronophila]|uniref:ATP-grasp domain-containing protein n=1 Tax=Nesterenkonia natronophila TaxID=2174932 RepID=A0A3A4F0E8_9MICC|nr:ATP-grasp domain-containing protein [Nesterenkonia natronophila]RJN31603.1 ATP-grasp domain-containing protein [Nesterenkonia natronophila]